MAASAKTEPSSARMSSMQTGRMTRIASLPRARRAPSTADWSRASKARASGRPVASSRPPWRAPRGAPEPASRSAAHATAARPPRASSRRLGGAAPAAPRGDPQHGQVAARVAHDQHVAVVVRAASAEAAIVDAAAARGD
jgi:hypothetical protein